jgi:putative membrane protein
MHAIILFKDSKPAWIFMDPLVLILGVAIFTVLGCLAGTVTGLVPGIHVNNLALITLSASSSISAFALLLFGWTHVSPEEIIFLISAFIIGAAISHSFLDFIPSVYLGAPGEEDALSVLPGHRMLLEGRGYEAIKCAALGSFGGALVSIALIFPVRFFMGSPIYAYDKLMPFVPHLLIIIVTMLIMMEGRAGEGRGLDFYKKKLWGLSIFLLSGFLGLLVLSGRDLSAGTWIPLRIGSASMLFPLLTGLFGLSTMIISLKDKAEMPEQKMDDEPVDLEGWRKTRGVLSGTMAGALVGWFPGISAGAATPIAKAFSSGDEQDEKDAKEYIVAVASVGTSCAIFVVVALFVIFKARSGAMMAVMELGSGTIIPWEPLEGVPVFLCLMILSILLASIFSTYLTLYFGAMFGKVFRKLDYGRVCLGIIVFLVVMIFLLTGIMGLVLAAVATCVGMIPPQVGTTRVHLMGCLIFPIILFYIGVGDSLMMFLGVT